METATQAPEEVQRGRRFRFPRWMFFVLVALAATGIAGGVYVHHWVKKAVYTELFPKWGLRWDSDVSVGKLSVSVFPTIRVVGDDLYFRQHGRESSRYPLLHARCVTVTGGLFSLLVLHPARFRSIEAEGLEVNVPPHGERPVDRSVKKESSRKKFWISDMRTENAILRVLPAASGDRPSEFHVRELHMTGSGVDGDVSYHVETTVPKPAGVVRSDGKFGPWAFDNASSIHISGEYDLIDADLSGFKAVLGHLNAHGRFRGPFDEIVASGSAEIPKFEATNAHHPVDLKATYECAVDATSGDVRIRSLVADFLRSRIRVHGSVAGKNGKEMALVADMEGSRLEDILRFVLKQPKPPFTGAAAFHWKFDAPMKTKDMIDALSINGSAALARVVPTRESTREKLDAISAKAQGEPDEAGEIDVASNIRGELAVHDGVAHLSGVSFRVPGLFVTLAGTYGLRSEELNLHGTARMEATLSETTKGVKSFFLKLVDPIFKRKKAGAVVPIHITGPAGSPSIRFIF